MKTEIDPKHILVFSGAGISAESGISTFRDTNGLWQNHSLDEVATPWGWNNNPQLVLNFYNARRKQLEDVEPNAAHFAIASLEHQYRVTVITQNVDDLHERAGSSEVIHLHGELTKARSTEDDSAVYNIGYKPITLGQLCELRSQLRPHIVWFGEDVPLYKYARRLFGAASKVLVVGTSLEVEPAASLVEEASHSADKIIVGLEMNRKPVGYKFIRAKATKMVPAVCDKWLAS